MRRKLVPLVLIVLLILVPTGAAVGQEVTAEQAFLKATNASRAEQGLPTLTLNAELTEIARGWTAQMASAGSISHNPNYSQSYTGEWSRMGENVGTTTMVTDIGSAVDRIHRAFLDSPSHLANVVGDYNQAGIGVLVADGGVMWVTVNFLQGPISPADAVAAQEPADEPVDKEDPVTQTRAAMPSHFMRG